MVVSGCSNIRTLTPDSLEQRHEEMSCVMRKPTFYICENKDADQLRGHHEADQAGHSKADQRLCTRFIDSTIPLPCLLSKSEISSL